MRQAFYIMSTNSYDSIFDPNSVNGEQQLRQDAWNRENDDLLSNWFNPGSQQREEFSQQVLLQQMQNDWNSAPNQMEQMKKAGINANVAASGIAGAGNAPSVGSPNSAIGAGAQGVSSAAQAAGAVSDAVNAGVNAYEKLSLTSTEKERKKAEIADLLSSAFHNQWLGRAVAEMLPLQKENERADTWLKLANFDKAREEKKLINKRIDEVQANINNLNKQADLFEKQGNLADAEKLRVQAQTDQIQLQNDKLQWDKDFREKWHFDNTKPIDNAMIEAMMFEDGDALGAVDTIGKSIELVSKSERKGFNAAEIEDGFDKAIETLAAQAEYAPYMAKIEANKQNIINMFKSLVENPDDIEGIFVQMVKLLTDIPASLSVDDSEVSKANKPIHR